VFEDPSKTAGISADFTTAKILLFFHACLLHKTDKKRAESSGKMPETVKTMPRKLVDKKA